MSFTDVMSVDEVAKWLINKGFSEEVRESFEREFVTTRHFTLFCRNVVSCHVTAFINSSWL